MALYMPGQAVFQGNQACLQLTREYRSNFHPSGLLVLSELNFLYIADFVDAEVLQRFNRAFGPIAAFFIKRPRIEIAFQDPQQNLPVSPDFCNIFAIGDQAPAYPEFLEAGFHVDTP